MPSREMEIFKQNYAVRTAQRFGLFVRRYHGPGEEFFSSGNNFGGLEALRIYFESNKAAKINLQGAEWNN